jgi:RHS repeat-associated protein
MIFIHLALWLVAALAVTLFGSTTGLAAFPPLSAVESAIHGYDETLDPAVASTTNIVTCAGGLRSQVLPVCSRASNDEHHAGAVELAPNQFTEKERDAETGLDFFEARYFSGAQGRFTSPDPENANAMVSDPQSWNMYAYGRNNPLSYTDPDGLSYRVCRTDENGKENQLYGSEE